MEMSEPGSARAVRTDGLRKESLLWMMKLLDGVVGWSGLRGWFRGGAVGVVGLGVGRLGVLM